MPTRQKYTFILLFICFLIVTNVLAQGNEFPRAARSVHLWYDAPEGMAFYNEVSVEKSVPGSYFCVCGFNHGYFGIQELWGGKKVVIFSVWDPGDQNDPAKVQEENRVKVIFSGDDVKISRFGNEGTGAKSMFYTDWELNQTVRCIVKAVVENDTTIYSAFVCLSETSGWKHLATFQTKTAGDPLKGYYSFVEDFRRNGESAKQIRNASFGNGWVKSIDGIWHPLTSAVFTADNTKSDRIDSGVKENRFYLQNGGDTVNKVRLHSKLHCDEKGYNKPEDPEWKLSWNDEFDYQGLPDAEKWNHEVGFIRNNEKQYYTRQRLENTRVENGSLLIEARKEGYKENAEYTSASIHTAGKKEWTYGRFEIRAKLPTGKGTWPAIWMLGKNIGQVGWPKCGEIDIMENVGYDPETIVGTIHCKSYYHVIGTQKSATIKVPTCMDKYHLYAIEWYDDRIETFVDNKHYFTFRNEGTGDNEWPFDKPHYLILNLAIGGAWGGQKGIDDSLFPHKYYIDYVRVYDKN